MMLVYEILKKFLILGFALILFAMSSLFPSHKASALLVSEGEWLYITPLVIPANVIGSFLRPTDSIMIYSSL